jgi:hypothetical protein
MKLFMIFLCSKQNSMNDLNITSFLNFLSLILALKWLAIASDKFIFSLFLYGFSISSLISSAYCIWIFITYPLIIFDLF